MILFLAHILRGTNPLKPPRKFRHVQLACLRLQKNHAFPSADPQAHAESRKTFGKLNHISNNHSSFPSGTAFTVLAISRDQIPVKDLLKPTNHQRNLHKASTLLRFTIDHTL